MFEKIIEILAALVAALQDNTKALRELASGSTTAAAPTAEPAKVERKKCACGKTKDAGGFCDGSHAK